MPAVLTPAASTFTRPILSADDRQTPFTLVRQTDARTAVARGLKEYLLQLSYAADGGRLVKFNRVLDTWAPAEDKLLYPSAAVIAVGPGVYEASRLTPNANTPVENEALVQTSELNIDLNIEIMASDSAQRMALVAMLEDALTPTDYSYGLRLELPHYHNARATYEPKTIFYDDNPDEALRRHRKALILVSCCMPVLRVANLPLMRPRGVVFLEPDPNATFSGSVDVFSGATVT
jgi:hypothetical protein